MPGKRRGWADAADVSEAFRRLMGGDAPPEPAGPVPINTQIIATGDGRVVVTFDQSVRSLVFPPASAEEFARALVASARDARGRGCGGK